MVRPIINDYDQLKKYAPRIAVIEDRSPHGGKTIQKLIKQAGGKPMVIPRMLTDRLLASQGLSKADIDRIKNAKNFEEVRDLDQQIATATRLHLQYITRKLTFVDAVVLPGSVYDIPPSAYHDTLVHQRTRMAPPMDARFQTELMMADYALYARKIPLLGISAGMQLLVVKTGGKLVQHLPEYDNFAAQVMQGGAISGVSVNGKELVLEKINAKNKELLSKLGPNFQMTEPQSILGVMLSNKDFEEITSHRLELLHLHHQGVRPEDVNASELKVTAMTEDGQYVEAVEHKYHPFCLGTQFHPEYSNDLGFRMIKEMVEYAREKKAESFDRTAQVPTYMDLHKDEISPALLHPISQWQGESLEMEENWVQ
jgi:putative glutamine amidotransferase